MRRWLLAAVRCSGLLFVACCLLVVVRCDVRCLLLGDGCSLFLVRCWLLVVGCSLSFVC